MIVENNNHNVTTNLKESIQFSVSENSSKIFSMLADNLYSDKPRAVITELSSNALDAHVTVNKQNVPFEIQLPTQLVPEIRIRDLAQGCLRMMYIIFLLSLEHLQKISEMIYVVCGV